MIRAITLGSALAAAVLTLPAIAQDVKTPAPAASATSSVLMLTLPEAQAWIGKPVYSSDGTKLGEVAALQRGADNKVTELDADIGGFLGFGEHRIRLNPGQFTLEADRIVLQLTAAQAKELPKIAS